ncbi:hypothetical protein NFI96_032058 [Prochilodus magdalenae]|nr:hypothetical protein NFI96_032058 [Prochilodus magdalenae]
MESHEEHTKEEVHDESNKEDQDEPWKHKTKSRIHQGEIVEGKREKKTVQRLDMQVAKPKEKPKVESIGKGDKLGDIARINHAIGKLKAPLLKPLHKIIYDRPGAVASLRKHLRLFNGFPFEVDSEPYNKKREKMTRLPKVQLRTICQILDLERSGNQPVLVDRIMQFLVSPTNSGKVGYTDLPLISMHIPVILKKKKKKKTTKDAKREKIASKSTKKQPESGKSKAIVTDSSSDDDDDEDDDDEGENKNKDAETSSVSDSQKHEGDESNSEGEEKVEKSIGSKDSSEESEDEETPKPKSKKASSKKKSTPKKAGKKAEDTSDQSLSDFDDSGEDASFRKTKKKPAAQKKAQAKPVPKTKKADSSSNKKKNSASKSKAVKSDSSDDDEPLIKMIKKPPSNEQLSGAIKDLLKDANLEEVTMKQICQQVYDLYPNYDLTDRKDFIKETVKNLIS